MTVRRARLRPDGVEISKAGIDVTTALFSEKSFSATNRSIPLLRKTSPVSLNSAIGGTTSLYYGKTFSHPPMSTVFLSPTYPSASGPYFMVSGLQSGNESYSPIEWALNYGGYIAAQSGTDIIRRNDRIDLTNWLYGSSATTLHGFAGWAWAVIFDYE